MKKIILVLFLLFSAPLFAASQIDLQTQVKGILPQVNGGTGATSVLTLSGTPMVGDLIYMTGTATGALLSPGTLGDVLTSAGAATAPIWATPGVGSGTVTSVSVTTANGVSGSVANATTTPAISLTLGAITPSSVVTGAFSSSGLLTLTGSQNVTAAGTNQATAAALSSTLTIHNVNSSSAGAGVILPTITLGNVHAVKNSTNNSILVYPNGTEQIADLGASAGMFLNPGRSVWLIPINAGTWVVLGLPQFNSTNSNLALTPEISGRYSITLGGVSRSIASATPSISSGFCTSPSITGSGASMGFAITIGTSCTGIQNGTLSIQSANNGWSCNFANVTAPDSFVVSQTGGATNTVTLRNYSRTTGLPADFTAGNVIRGSCFGY